MPTLSKPYNVASTSVVVDKPKSEKVEVDPDTTEATFGGKKPRKTKKE